MHHSVLRQVNKESIAVSSSSVALTTAKITRAGGGQTMKATIFVENNAIRFNRGGADAVATDPRIPAGSIITIEGHADIKAARFIRDTADAVIRVQYDA